MDHTSGYLVFNDPNNPYINAETDIEIRYEYLPLDGQTQSFVGGIRADYAFNENFNVGGSVLYSKSSTGTDIPLVGETPTQTVLLEGDALLYLYEMPFNKIGMFLTNKEPKRVPVEFKARIMHVQYPDVNTGKALIDNMESSELSLFMSEKHGFRRRCPRPSSTGRCSIITTIGTPRNRKRSGGSRTSRRRSPIR